MPEISLTQQQSRMAVFRGKTLAQTIVTPGGNRLRAADIKAFGDSLRLKTSVDLLRRFSGNPQVNLPMLGPARQLDGNRKIVVGFSMRTFPKMVPGGLKNILDPSATRFNAKDHERDGLLSLAKAEALKLMPHILRYFDHLLGSVRLPSTGTQELEAIESAGIVNKHSAFWVSDAKEILTPEDLSYSESAELCQPTKSWVGTTSWNHSRAIFLLIVEPLA